MDSAYVLTSWRVSLLLNLEKSEMALDTCLTYEKTQILMITISAIKMRGRRLALRANLVRKRFNFW